MGRGEKRGSSQGVGQGLMASDLFVPFIFELLRFKNANKTHNLSHAQLFSCKPVTYIFSRPLYLVSDTQWLGIVGRANKFHLVCLLCSVSSGSLECSAEKDFEAVSGLSEKEFSG